MSKTLRSGETLQVGTMELHVVRTIPLMLDGGAMRTVGAMVDEIIENAVDNGQTVSKMTVNLTDAFWNHVS